jgi:hypothetical protein
MSSILQKIRSLLEASLAMSPAVIGLACATLDLAALLHLRIKAAQPAGRLHASIAVASGKLN